MNYKPLLLGLLAVGLPAASHALVLDFEGPDAPDSFADADAFRDLYASINVTFVGPADGSGGALLHTDSSFGLTANSGVNFLAFEDTGILKTGGTASDPERIVFGYDPGFVSIWVASGAPESQGEQFFLKAYDATDELIGTDTIVTTGWAQMTVIAGGISYVEFWKEGGGLWGADDLITNGVPEPASMLTLGLGALAVAVRRKRK